jgi:PilZ domain
MLKAGKIISADSATMIDCIVCDLNNLGAGLRISPEDSVPNFFDLIFDSHLFSRTCQVRWQHGERLGVEFSDGSNISARCIAASSARPRGSVEKPVTGDNTEAK